MHLSRRRWRAASAAILSACSELVDAAARAATAHLPVPYRLGVEDGHTIPEARKHLEEMAEQVRTRSRQCMLWPDGSTSTRLLVPLHCTIVAIASSTIRDRPPARALLRQGPRRCRAACVRMSRSPDAVRPYAGSFPGRGPAGHGKPRASSAPSALWPPTNTAPAGSSTSSPPRSM